MEAEIEKDVKEFIDLMNKMRTLIMKYRNANKLEGFLDLIFAYNAQKSTVDLLSRIIHNIYIRFE